MNCKLRSDFHLEDLISDVDKGLSSEENTLLVFFERMDKNLILDKARDTFYHRISKEFDAYGGELEARDFWDDVATTAEDDEFFGKIKLSPDENEVLNNARKGLVGKNLYLRITNWFYANGFIRKDITVWNCRLFRYIDSYLMIKDNIIVGIFDNYETIGDIKRIRTEAMAFLKKNIPSRIMRIIENSVDTDEKIFEGIIEETELSEQEKELKKVGNECLKPLAEDIYKIVFKAHQKPGC